MFGAFGINGLPRPHRKGRDIAGATVTEIPSDGFYFDITGTPTITSFKVAAGRWFIAQFDGVAVLTHNAVTLDLPTEANVTTAAGDSALCYALAQNAVHVVSYTRANGQPLAGGVSLGTESTTTGGTEIDLSISTGATLVMMPVMGLSLSGTSNLLFQLGDAGGIEPSGYLGGGVQLKATMSLITSTAGLEVEGGADASLYHGIVIWALEDRTNNSWTGAYLLSRSDTAQTFVGATAKSLTAALTTVRITAVNGSDTIDVNSGVAAVVQ